jgi:tetratricopeptide (TPR) repeat protein
LRRACLIILTASLALTLYVNYAHSEETKTPTLELGIGQYKHENYDEALITLKKAREENPDSSLAAYYLGLTYKQLQDYDSAIPYLKDAVTFSPKIQGALIELIDCYYQLGRTEDAKTWIAQAEADGVRPAQVSFIKGLVLAKEGKDEEAISAFKKAKELDRLMSQSCDYQIGMIYVKAKRYSDARTALTEVVVADPNSNMANFANEYMGTLSKREEAMKPLRITAGAYWQYDDNVLLKPDDDTLASGITDQGDSRQVYTASANYNLPLNDIISMRGLYTFYYAKQFNLGFYDMVDNSIIGQPTVYLKDVMLTFPSGYRDTRVNDKRYLGTASTSAMASFNVANCGMGNLFLSYQSKDYFWGPSTPDEDRTGYYFGGGTAWYIFFSKNKGFMNFRYELNKEATKGCNWDYIGNRATATLLLPIMDRLNATITGDVFFQNFLNTNTTYGVERRDQVYTLSALISYKIFSDNKYLKDSEVQLQYTHVKDDSNISVYAYNRNIYSVGVELRF